MDITPTGQLPLFVPPLKAGTADARRPESLPPLPEEPRMPSSTSLTSLVQKLKEMPEIRPEVVQEAREKLQETGLLTDDAVTAILSGLPALRED